MADVERSTRVSGHLALLVSLCLHATCGSVVSSAAPPATAVSAVRTDELREFDIFVDGKFAGTHRLGISSSPGAVTTARIESDVKINFIVYAYTYKFRATEVWRDDGLAQIDVGCEDGGKKTTLTAKSEGAHCRVVLNGRQQVTDRSVMTTAYWRLPPEVDQKRVVSILDVETGVAKPGVVERIGRTTLKVNGRPMVCRHYKVTGPSPAELWFDEQDRLVRQTSVEEGHPMELRLRRITEQAAE